MENPKEEPKEEYGPDEDPIPLQTRADVRRYLAKCLRRIAKGTLTTSQGHCLVIGLGTLAKMMVEDDATEVLKRLRAIEARQEAQTQ